MSILKGLCGALELQGLAQRTAGASCFLESFPFREDVYFILTLYGLFLALISPVRSGWKVQQGPYYPSLPSPQLALILLLSDPGWGVALWIPFHITAVFTNPAGFSLPAAYLPLADKPSRSLSIGL